MHDPLIIYRVNSVHPKSLQVQNQNLSDHFIIENINKRISFLSEIFFYLSLSFSTALLSFQTLLTMILNILDMEIFYYSFMLLLSFSISLLHYNTIPLRFFKSRYLTRNELDKHGRSMLNNQ